MSWKDVRKNAKDSGGDGKGEVEDVLDDGAGTLSSSYHGHLSRLTNFSGLLF